MSLNGTNLTTTDTVSKLIGNGLFKSGYAPGAPCIFHLFANQSAPFIDLEASGSIMDMYLDMQMMCQQDTPGDETYYQVSTIQFAAVFNMTLDVYDNVTIYGDINSLSLNILGTYNNTVKVSLIKSRAELVIITPIIQMELNKKLNAGFSVNGFISEKTPLKFFNLTYMEIEVFDHFLTIAMIPQFDHRNVTNELFDPEAWNALGDLLYPEDLDNFGIENDLLREVDAHVSAMKEEALKAAFDQHHEALSEYGF